MGCSPLLLLLLLLFAFPPRPLWLSLGCSVELKVAEEEALANLNRKEQMVLIRRKRWGVKRGSGKACGDQTD